MALYSIDLASAARRHLRAGQLLDIAAEPGVQPGCKAIAGYLFGLAGELALKQLMRELLNLRPKSGERGRGDPFFAHFPELRSMLLDMEASHGRRAAELRAILADQKFFQDWNIKMRYAPATDVKSQWVSAWRTTAEELVSRMDAF